MVSKKEEALKVEADNLIEDACEIFESCVKCGMCKAICPVFKVLREEQFSARGKAVLVSEKVLDSVFFDCNLCKGCEVKCPLGIKVCDGVLKIREAMVLKGKGLKENEEMIENIRKFGNPFGKGGADKDKLYCC